MSPMEMTPIRPRCLPRRASKSGRSAIGGFRYLKYVLDFHKVRVLGNLRAENIRWLVSEEGFVIDGRERIKQPRGCVLILHQLSMLSAKGSYDSKLGQECIVASTSLPVYLVQ